MNLAAQLRRFIAPLAHRIAHLAARAVLDLVDDGNGLQTVQLRVLRGETRGDVERLQSYGLSSHPHPGAEALAIFLGGNRDHGIVVQVDDRRYRLRGLAQGEVALYTDEGDKVHLRRGRQIEVVAGGSVTIDSPSTTITGDLTVEGSATVQGAVTAESTLDVTGPVTAAATVTAQAEVLALGGTAALGVLRTAYNAHTHTETGGTTAPPTPAA